MANALCFFGAGASAPFGIPTMQGMVAEFEKTLQEQPKAKEKELYADICHFLNATLSRKTDLEAVFTVVDSIINWSPDRMGVAALYHATKAAQAFYSKYEDKVVVQWFREEESILPALQPPPQELVEVARSLESDFERFVQTACQIREGDSERIDATYKAFFDAVGAVGGYNFGGTSGRTHTGLFPMFTTNYDAVLEHYWLDIVGVPLNTGFAYDRVSRMEISNPEVLREESTGTPRLFKLHGSVTWYLDEHGRLTEQRVPPQGMRTVTGRKFLGQVMLYPIEEKDLFVEPYETMYLMLNRELAAANRWVVVGYSFGDRILRDIFVRNSRSSPKTNLILLHPEATKIANRLAGFKGTIRPIDARFGGEDFEQVTRALRSAMTAA